MYADAVATGQLTTNVTTIRTSRVLQELAAIGTWRVTENNGLVIGSITSRKAQREMQEYWHKENRKQHDWSIFKCIITGGKFSLREKATRMKLFLCRFERDRLGELGLLPKCKCGCRNNIDDWLEVCSDPNVLKLRDQGYQKAQQCITSGPLGTAFRIRMTINKARLWRGDWRAEDIQVIKDHLHIEHPNWKILNLQLLAAIHTLGATALTIQQTITGKFVNKRNVQTQAGTRKGPGKTKRGLEMRQQMDIIGNHKITEYFQPSKRQTLVDIRKGEG